MPSFTYTTNIPNPPNNPSVDVPNMQTNTNSINSIINVDHFTFASASSNDGFHKQITYATENIPGLAPTDPASIAFTANASSLVTQTTSSQTTQAQNFFQNNNGIFPLSCIRAFVRFPFVNAGNPVISNGFNISTVVASAAFKTYTINFVANTCSSNKYVPIWSTTTSQSITALSTNTGSIVFTFGTAPSAGGIFSLLILQV